MSSDKHLQRIVEGIGKVIETVDEDILEEVLCSTLLAKAAYNRANIEFEGEKGKVTVIPEDLGIEH